MTYDSWRDAYFRNDARDRIGFNRSNRARYQLPTICEIISDNDLNKRLDKKRYKVYILQHPLVPVATRWTTSLASLIRDRQNAGDSRLPREWRQCLACLQHEMKSVCDRARSKVPVNSARFKDCRARGLSFSNGAFLFRARSARTSRFPRWVSIVRRGQQRSCVMLRRVAYFLSRIPRACNRRSFHSGEFCGFSRWLAVCIVRSVSTWFLGAPVDWTDQILSPSSRPFILRDWRLPRQISLPTELLRVDFYVHATSPFLFQCLTASRTRDNDIVTRTPSFCHLYYNR